MGETITTAPREPQSATPQGSAVAPSSPLTRREVSLLIALVLVAATVILYRPTLHQFFQTYDDPPYVVENTHVQQGLSWSSMRWAFTATEAANWHPITWISHMMDVQLFGGKPMGHHLDSMLWHTLDVVLLFFLLRAATGHLWRSAVVAALFAFCPLNVECVAWVAERKSLISTAFFLLTLFAYGWYVRRPNVARYGAVALLFALGLMAKPMLVTLPVLLLAVDYWPLRRFDLPRPFETASLKRFGLLLAEKLPLLLLSAASSLITVLAQGKGGALGWSFVIRLRYRIENAIYSYVLYIVKMFWPSNLAAFYPHPRGSLNPWMVVAAGLVLAAITAAAWRYRAKRVFAACWAWYVVALAPVIGIIQVGPQGWADRYAYVPFIGLFVAVVWLVADSVEALAAPPSRTVESSIGARDPQSVPHPNDPYRGMPYARATLTAVSVLALSAYAWVSHIQIGYWNDSYSLFSRALQVTPRNGVAEGILGLASMGAGRLDVAERDFRIATEFMPDVPTFRYDLGVVYQRQGRVDDALREYRASLLLGEGAPAYNSIASILLSRGDFEGALAQYNAAVSLEPENAESLTGRGVAELRLGKLDAAVADLTKATQLSPNAAAYYVLGRAFESKGDLSSAERAYESALALDPSMPEASSRLQTIRGR